MEKRKRDIDRVEESEGDGSDCQSVSTGSIEKPSRERVGETEKEKEKRIDEKIGEERRR